MIVREYRREGGISQRYMLKYITKNINNRENNKSCMSRKRVNLFISIAIAIINTTIHLLNSHSRFNHHLHIFKLIIRPVKQQRINSL